MRAALEHTRPAPPLHCALAELPLLIDRPLLFHVFFPPGRAATDEEVQALIAYERKAMIVKEMERLMTEYPYGGGAKGAALLQQAMGLQDADVSLHQGGGGVPMMGAPRGRLLRVHQD